MGLFAEWQPRYADHDLAIFPCIIDGKDKKPAAANLHRVKLQGSRELAKKPKYRDSDAFGLWLNHSPLAVLDVDSTDEHVLADGLSRHGDSPIVIRTASGKFHALYQLPAGTPRARLVKPAGGNADTDYLIGQGLWICAPSLSPVGQYQFAQGSLDDLDRLPPMQGLEGIEGIDGSFRTKPPAPGKPHAPPVPGMGGRIGEGSRNETLFKRCLGAARHCDSFDDLLDVARTYAEDAFFPPLPDAEIEKTARSAWGYQARGENWCGRGGVVAVAHEEVDGLMMENPDAFLLLTKLRRHHWGQGRNFFIANGMAEQMPGGGWPRKRLAAARRHLETRQFVEVVRPPSTFRGAARGAALYRFKAGRI
ncbi:bifunctional DNA primase/polymerase [Geminicoccus harenae]|uniref:bifunctional DNA primase/polymerase n=1 Tax=Geminicoccus harenae TaxID=2498453 RepID=UPI00168B39D7|nr:bifunctional DNA primase/polymerase [Geminicoccus harenae]